MSPLKFTPAQLMEGYSIHEVFEAIKKIEDILDAAFGADSEVKVTALAFVLGRNLRGSKVTQDMAFSMAASASTINLPS